MNYLTRKIRSLAFNGVQIREIARRLDVAPSTVHKVIHGHNLPDTVRCPVCGAKLSDGKCYACELKKKLNEVHDFPPDFWTCYLQWDGEPITLGLELRPAERKRYLAIRRRKEQELRRATVE